MTGKPLTNLYDHLTAEERFRLAVEARARRDITELGRLASSCPLISVSTGDPAYTNRLDAAFDIGRMIGFDLLPDLRVLKMLEYCFARTNRCLICYINERETPSGARPPVGSLELELREAFEVQKEVIRRTAVRIKSRWTAVEGFCRAGWGIEPWIAICAYCPQVATVWEGVATTLGSAEVDAAQVTAYREHLDVTFKRIFQLPTGYRPGAITPRRH